MTLWLCLVGFLLFSLLRNLRRMEANVSLACVLAIPETCVSLDKRIFIQETKHCSESYSFIRKIIFVFLPLGSVYFSHGFCFFVVIMKKWRKTYRTNSLWKELICFFIERVRKVSQSTTELYPSGMNYYLLWNILDWNILDRLFNLSQERFTISCFNSKIILENYLNV